ncbi:hypothetical protein [Cypionkella sp.]|uniref:hypothetical protein n=1 Tax=Cypionkella sp. TaxID=2811411 RepID=UPI00261DE41B|nr:hypothetical protein [Cypionkella sp.]MDB5666075.1 hypothetical protein [Cypionkella sp.]
MQGKLTLQAFWIDRETGAICFNGGRLGVGDGEGAVVGATGQRRDMGNGYVWLDVEGLTFGGAAAVLALAFFEGRFCEASWAVMLFGEADGWPTGEAMVREVTFVRGVLREQVGLAAGRGAARFEWGEVWSGIDLRGGSASHGLRYGVRKRGWLGRLWETARG